MANKPEVKLSIVVRFQVEGWHFWPGAPDQHAYLRHSHRHMFHVEATLPVTSENREVEFILLRRQMKFWIEQLGGVHSTEALCDDIPHWLGAVSCESLAHRLLGRFKLSRCEVWEDGENGAVAEQEVAQ